MGFEITAYRTHRMRAEVNHSGTSHWVEVTIEEPRRYRGGPSESTLTVFFDGDDAGRKADAYAAAINTVDRQFHGVQDVLNKHFGAKEPV
jgi:hypothetical protein